jgi:hypothetical protein
MGRQVMGSGPGTLRVRRFIGKLGVVSLPAVQPGLDLDERVVRRHVAKLEAAGWLARAPWVWGEGSVVWLTSLGIERTGLGGVRAVKAPPSPTTIAHGVSKAGPTRSTPVGTPRCSTTARMSQSRAGSAASPRRQDSPVQNSMRSSNRGRRRSTPSPPPPTTATGQFRWHPCQRPTPSRRQPSTRRTGTTSPARPPSSLAPSQAMSMARFRSRAAFVTHGSAAACA